MVVTIGAPINVVSLIRSTTAHDAFGSMVLPCVNHMAFAVSLKVICEYLLNYPCIHSISTPGFKFPFALLEKLLMLSFLQIQQPSDPITESCEAPFEN